MNPLETNQLLSIELMNPNPTSSKTKNGPVYRVSFEVQRDAWDCFMDAETSGMVLDGSLRVTARNEPVGPPEKRKGGALSREAAMLCQDADSDEYAKSHGHTDFKSMIYELCDIDSRAELDHDDDAAGVYRYIKKLYVDWLNERS